MNRRNFLAGLLSIPLVAKALPRLLVENKAKPLATTKATNQPTGGTFTIHRSSEIIYAGQLVCMKYGQWCACEPEDVPFGIALSRNAIAPMSIMNDGGTVISI